MLAGVAAGLLPAASPLLGRPAVQVVDAVQVHVLGVPARVGWCGGGGAGVGWRRRGGLEAHHCQVCGIWAGYAGSSADKRDPGCCQEQAGRRAPASPGKQRAPGADVEVRLVHAGHADAVRLQRVAQQRPQAAQAPALEPRVKQAARDVGACGRGGAGGSWRLRALWRGRGWGLVG